MTEPLPPDTLPIGTHVICDGQRVEIVAAYSRRGYRITNRRWGGQVDRWVPLDALTIDKNPAEQLATLAQVHATLALYWPPVRTQIAPTTEGTTR